MRVKELQDLLQRAISLGEITPDSVVLGYNDELGEFYEHKATDVRFASVRNLPVQSSPIDRIYEREEYAHQRLKRAQRDFRHAEQGSSRKELLRKVIQGRIDELLEIRQAIRKFDTIWKDGFVI